MTLASLLLMIGAKEAIPFNKDFNLRLLFTARPHRPRKPFDSSRISKSLCGVFFVKNG